MTGSVLNDNATPSSVASPAPRELSGAVPERQRFRHLMRNLASSLALEPEPEAIPVAVPFVYTTAIQSSADLVTSLTGIARLARELGQPAPCHLVPQHLPIVLEDKMNKPPKFCADDCD